MQGWGAVAGWRTRPEQELHSDGADQRRLGARNLESGGVIGIFLAFISLQRVKMPCRWWPEEDDDDEADEEEEQQG